MRTRFSLCVENKKVGVERDDQTCLVRPDAQAQTGTAGNYPRSADHEQDWQPYPIDPYSAKNADHALSKALCIFPNSPGLRYGYTLASH